MDKRLIRPRTLDESRVGALIDALEAAVARHTPVRPGSEVPASEKLTYFHSRVLPSPSVRALVRALVKARIAFDWTTAAMAVSLVERCRRADGPKSITPHMLHRMMIGCLLVAAKAHQDVIPTNRLVAKTVGISKLELARIEQYTCERLCWRMCVDHNDLVLDEVELCGQAISVEVSPAISEQSELASTQSSTTGFDRSAEYVPA